MGTEQDRRWPRGQVKGSVAGDERKSNKTENVGEGGLADGQAIGPH